MYKSVVLVLALATMAFADSSIVKSTVASQDVLPYYPQLSAASLPQYASLGHYQQYQQYAPYPAAYAGYNGLYAQYPSVAAYPYSSYPASYVKPAVTVPYASSPYALH